MDLRNLAKKLNSAKAVRQVAELIRDAADKLIAWDSFYVDLYSAELDIMTRVLLLDVIEGQRVEVSSPSRNLEPSATFREVCFSEPGSKLIIRKGTPEISPHFQAFGDRGRPSASLMFLALRTESKIFGIMSLQSYTPNAYSEKDLQLAEYLADQCCGAFARLETEKNYSSIFENAVEGLCQFASTGTLLTANRSLARMLGYNDVLELSQVVTDIKSQLFSLPESHCEFEKQLRLNRVVEGFETQLRNKTGGDLWVSINAHIELDSNREALYFEATIQDITDRKRAQMELSRTEALYREAISAGGAVSYATNYATRSYTFIDPAIEKLIGYRAEEMVPEVWGQILQKRIMRGDVAGLDAIEAADRVRKGMAQHWHCDMLVTSRSGKKRWISDASVQSLGPDGKPMGSVGILQDITDRKQSELTALSFAKLSHGLSTASSVEAASEIVGGVSQEMFGWDAYWVKLYNPEDDALYRVMCIDTIDGTQIWDDNRVPQKPTGMNLRALTTGAELILRGIDAKQPDTIPFGDKSRTSASIMIAPIRYRDKIVGIVSVQSYTPVFYNQQDLTNFQMLADHCGGSFERIWADEALRKSESQFRVVWDSSADAMRLADADGMVLMVNEAYCRLVDKTKSELEGESMSIIHTAANRERVLQAHCEKCDGDTPEYRLEKEVTLWNEKRIWIELSSSLLKLPGQRGRLLTIMRDISDRKRAESELHLLNQQLIGTSRKAGMAEVASGVLHNVGNVLNSVNVAANVVTERLRNSRQSSLGKVAQLLDEHSENLAEFFSTDLRAKQLPAYVRKLADYMGEEQNVTLKELETLRKNIDHIKDIVAMQQSYAKVSGLIESHKVENLVEDALQMNAGALARHDVHLIKNYEASPTISTDKHKILQILVNFIRNAKYACDEGPNLDKRVTVSIRVPADRVHIVVEDNGVGIIKENVTRIFSHGFTTREGGHGFGLHSSALAAKELGGQILVHSDGEGKGATFTLELPFAMEADKI